MSEFYQKYKETIKIVTKRNYRKRIVWLNEYLGNKSCHYCGESENVCLQFHPHEGEIRKRTKRKGLNDESRKEVLELINQSKIVCANCYLKLESDLIDIM
jgi:predicted molibdopterin-dependent oxidoreductase YjgC|tara:strand:- start:426 stop:725 length:300 start_codon:yes stop_codon:yes gene_type:complete